MRLYIHLLWVGILGCRPSTADHQEFLRWYSEMPANINAEECTETLCAAATYYSPDAELALQLDRTESAEGASDSEKPSRFLVALKLKADAPQDLELRLDSARLVAEGMRLAPSLAQEEARGTRDRYYHLLFANAPDDTDLALQLFTSAGPFTLHYTQHQLNELPILNL